MRRVAYERTLAHSRWSNTRPCFCSIRRPLADAAWQQLGTLREPAGGGLALFLGENADSPADFNKPAAAGTAARARWATRPDARRRSGAAARRERAPAAGEVSTRCAGTMPWEAFPVYRYWQFAKLATGVQTVIPYSNGRPAMVEKPLGKGRVVTMTTPFSEPLTGGDRRSLEPAAHRLRALAFRDALQRVGSVPGRRDGKPVELRWLGQSAVLPLEEHQRHPTYQVVTPRRPVPASHPRAGRTRSSSPRPSCRATTGSRLAARRASIVGFSVNLAAVEATRLERIDRARTQRPFRRLHVPPGASASRSNARSAPTAWATSCFRIVMLRGWWPCWGLEQVLANRFYRRARREPA